MGVPFIDLKRSLIPLKSKVLADWERCFDETQFVGGAFVAKLEERLRASLQVKHAVPCANGTDAIILALQAAGIKSGMKVAIPNMTFWATYEAVAQIGAEAVLVDIDATDLQLSYDGVVAAHERFKLDAVIIAHLMGWCSSQLQDLRAFCQKQNIRLIEDGAQSYGVAISGEPVYKGAEVGTVSFYPAKVIGGAMDGGLVTTNSDEIASLVRVLQNHGRATHYSYSHVGWNSRMGGIQASFLVHCVDHADEFLNSRRAAVQWYRERLADLGEKVHMYQPPKGVQENGYLVALTSPVATGEKISSALKAMDIGSANTYPQTIDVQAPAAGALKVGDLRVGKEFCERVFNLPLFAGITQDEVSRSVDALKQVINRM